MKEAARRRRRKVTLVNKINALKKKLKEHNKKPAEDANPSEETAYLHAVVESELAMEINELKELLPFYEGNSSAARSIPIKLVKQLYDTHLLKEKVSEAEAQAKEIQDSALFMENIGDIVSTFASCSEFTYESYRSAIVNAVLSRCVQHCAPDAHYNLIPEFRASRNTSGYEIGTVLDYVLLPANPEIMAKHTGIMIEVKGNLTHVMQRNLSLSKGARRL
ncbi:hypothetical protein HDU86_001344, partial [Geranomyces michiganensis]